MRAGTVPRVPRPPPPSSDLASRVMRANRAHSTGPELRLRKSLRSAGVLGYRTSNRDLPGTPDLTFPAESLAVFVHGCFWHRCPKHGTKLPKSNTSYWELKFRLNKARDRRNARKLRAIGWEVLTVWECEITADPHVVAEGIRQRLARAS
jgi:DNA mismatch endonuclease (patch repair protein)